MPVQIVKANTIFQLFIACLFFITASVSFAEEPTAEAVIETKYGNIELVFFRDVAPKHVENFLNLASSGFYDGTIFHRVIPGFMIQDGDPNTKGTDK